jgi:hypothetical protein
MAAFDLEEIGGSRFLPARFHAHLVFRLAGRASIIFHAGALLIAAHLAASRLLSLRRVGLIRTNKHQQRYRKESHDKISPRC